MRRTPDNLLLTTYNIANDFRSDCTTRRLATAVGIASAIRSNLVAREARVGSALQRISSRNRLGSTDAGRDDRNLHPPLRGNLQSQVQRKRFPVGFRAVPFLWSLALECFSGSAQHVGECSG